MRSTNFRHKTNNRYWWHNLKDTDYAPDIYNLLSQDEWNLLESWFIETEKNFTGTGEMQIPAISFLSGLINGNGLSRIVQCGHYIGYSSLLLGFLLKRMNKTRCIFSIDIDEKITEYTNKWIEKANLNNQIRLCVKNSADPQLLDIVDEYFLGQKPQLVIIDSSHQYDHTIEELDLWWPRIIEGGFLIMHDVSVFASSFDQTNRGGVHKAINDWLALKNNLDYSFLRINNFVNRLHNGNELSYKDGCGLGIIQKCIK